MNDDDQITTPKHAPVPYGRGVGMDDPRDSGSDSLFATIRSVGCAGGIVLLAVTGHCDGTYALIALAGIAVPGILDTFLTLKGARK